MPFLLPNPVSAFMLYLFAYVYLHASFKLSTVPYFLNYSNALVSWYYTVHLCILFNWLLLPYLSCWFSSLFLFPGNLQNMLSTITCQVGWMNHSVLKWRDLNHGLESTQTSLVPSKWVPSMKRDMHIRWNKESTPIGVHLWFSDHSCFYVVTLVHFS